MGDPTEAAEKIAPAPVLPAAGVFSVKHVTARATEAVDPAGGRATVIAGGHLCDNLLVVLDRHRERSCRRPRDAALRRCARVGRAKTAGLGFGVAPLI